MAVKQTGLAEMVAATRKPGGIGRTAATQCTAEMELNGGMLCCMLASGHEGEHRNSGMCWTHQRRTASKEAVAKEYGLPMSKLKPKADNPFYR